jgi:hypothetical protein
MAHQRQGRTGLRRQELKGHGNEADFLGFCRNRFGIGSLHYISSRSDLGFVFESTRMPIDTIFFKPLNKSMVTVHHIPGFFVCQIDLLKGRFSRLKGHGNEADFLGFLQKLGPHRSLTLPFEPFRYWLRIRGDICNRKTTPRRVCHVLRKKKKGGK